jgi:hypothetical protein
MVKDLCESLIAEDTRENERANYFRRVAAIKEICEKALERAAKINKAFDVKQR